MPVNPIGTQNTETRQLNALHYFVRPAASNNLKVPISKVVDRCVSEYEGGGKK
jgi:hypothetical protein